MKVYPIVLTTILTVLLAAPSFAQVPLSPDALPDIPGISGILSNAPTAEQFERLLPKVSAKARVRDVAVDCDAGQTIEKAIRQNRKVDVLGIYFLGTCEEVVNIERDLVTLRGLGDGAVVRGVNVRAGGGIVLRDFSVIEGPGTGIFIDGGSLVDMENIVSSGNAIHGINIEGATVRAHNLVANDNPAVGLLVARSGVLTITGGLDTSNNGIVGLVAASEGHVRATGIDFVSNDNGGPGTLLQVASSIVILGGTLVAEGNGTAGFSVELQSSAFIQFLDIRSSNNGLGFNVETLSVIVEGNNTIEIANNELAGIHIDEKGMWTTTLDSESVIEIYGNVNYGIRVVKDSVLSLGGVQTRMTLRDNPSVGIHMIDSSADLDGLTAFGNNGADVVVEFGSSAIIEDSDIENLICGVGSLLDIDGEQSACAPLDAATAAVLRPLRHMEKPQSPSLSTILTGSIDR